MLQDLRLALRGLSRAPGFSAVVIVSLALGIGGGSAIFTLVDAVLLRPLPFPDPSRLYTFKGSHSLPDLHDLQAASPSVAGMGAYASWAFDTNLGAEPERIEGALVSGGVLGALGVRAALGRLLGPEDDRAGAAPVAMVSQQFFRDKLGADPRVLGRTLASHW